MSRPPTFFHNGGGRNPAGRGGAGGGGLAMGRIGHTVPHHHPHHTTMIRGNVGTIPPPPPIMPFNSNARMGLSNMAAPPPPPPMPIIRPSRNSVSPGMINNVRPPPPPPPHPHSIHGRGHLNTGRFAQATSSYHMQQQRAHGPPFQQRFNRMSSPNSSVPQQYPFPPPRFENSQPVHQNRQHVQPHNIANFNLPQTPTLHPLQHHIDNKNERRSGVANIHTNQHTIPTTLQNTPGMLLPVATSSTIVVEKTNEYTREQLDQAWTQHTAPNGAVYYHNSITKTSSYEKPEAMKLKELSDEQNNEISKPWKQYTDPNTGKKYYSNGLSTTWDRPKGFIDHEVKQDVPVAVEPPKKKKKSSETNDEIIWESKEEAVAGFKALMLEKGISPSTKWNDIAKSCATDTKWIACEMFLTIGERKQALAEYQTKRSNDLRDIERKEKIRAREDFLQLMTESLVETNGFSPWTSTLKDVLNLLEYDDRYRKIENQSIRESLFLDFCEEFKKREERKKRLLHRGAQESFEAFLKEQEESGALNCSSTWISFVSSLGENQRNDPRFELSEHLSDTERQLYFADFIIHLQKLDDERRLKARSERVRIDEAHRLTFLEDIKELCRNGELLPTSTWRNVGRTISRLPSFGQLQEQGRNDPREIFEDFLAEWENSYRRDKSFLKRIICPSHSQPIRLNANTSIDDFRKLILDASKTFLDATLQVQRIFERSDPVSSAQIFLNELLQEAREQNETMYMRRNSTRRQGVESSEDEEGEIEE
jgi:pre-mRNA-processing factor 40